MINTVISYALIISRYWGKSNAHTHYTTLHTVVTEYGGSGVSFIEVMRTSTTVSDLHTEIVLLLGRACCGLDTVSSFQQTLVRERHGCKIATIIGSFMTNTAFRRKGNTCQKTRKTTPSSSFSESYSSLFERHGNTFSKQPHRHIVDYLSLSWRTYKSLSLSAVMTQTISQKRSYYPSINK